MGITSAQYQRQHAEKMIRERIMAFSKVEIDKLMEAFDVFIEYFPVHRAVELVDLARLRASYVNLTPVLVAEIMTTVQRTDGRTR